MKYLLTLFAAFSALPANAILIDVAGEQWNVEASRTSVRNEGVEDLLRSQTWWGDSERAYAFADAVRGQLGTQTLVFSDSPFYQGPLFAYEMFPPDAIYWPINGWSASFGHRPDNEFQGLSNGHTLYGNSWFAFATRVSAPEPGTLALLLGGGILMAALRRRPLRSARAR